MSLVQTLADFVHDTTYADLPVDLQARLADDVMDVLGCMFRGVDTPWGHSVIERLREREESHHSTIPGTTVGGHPDNVAFAAAVLAHSLDLDDYHSAAKLHPASVVFPVVFALGERDDLAGETVLEACAVGFETMIRAGLALGSVNTMLAGFHLTGICGSLGAAASAAHLLGLDPSRTAHAVGLAATQSAGLMGFLHGGSETKRINPGRAAHAGITAAELAARGLTGPERVIELEHGGFCRTFSPDPDPDEFIRDLGTRWHSVDVSFKKHACCGSIQASLDAVESAFARAGKPAVDDIDSVTIQQSAAVVQQCGWPYEPSDVLHAQMSLRYCVSVLLLEGRVGPDQFRPDMIADPEVLELTRRIDVIHNPDLDATYPQAFSSRIALTARGTTEEETVEHPRGSSRNPMSRAELRDKFLEMGRHHLDGVRLEMIADRAQDLAETDGIGNLIADCA